MDIADVFPRVRDAVARSGDLPPEEVTLESRLVDDLGMESLDLIDLVYEIERAFGITVPMGSIDLTIEEAMGDVPYQKDGVLTEAGLASLREMVPGLAQTDAPEIAVDDVAFMFTVRSICGLLVVELSKGGGTHL